MVKIKSLLLPIKCTQWHIYKVEIKYPQMDMEDPVSTKSKTNKCSTMKFIVCVFFKRIISTSLKKKTLLKSVQNIYIYLNTF